MILFALLALDVAAGAHGGLSPDGVAVVALVLAIIAIALLVTRRSSSL